MSGRRARGGWTALETIKPGKSSKAQHPRSKEIPSIKVHGAGTRHDLGLDLGTSLVFGAWELELFSRA
ncbi:MAG: hypothetical protein ACJ8M1_10185, partial [Chthoniobacterales bacterium]